MKTILDDVYGHESQRPNALWMTQPTGDGAVKTFTFGTALEEARRMAAHLVSLNFPPKSTIAIFSKNTAWWLIADLAIWMAGHVSVPVYPTLAADSVRRILEHSESKLIFVGKLDGFEQMAPGIPEALPQIVMPLAPTGAQGKNWADIVKSTPPLQGKPAPGPDDLATIIYTSGSTGEPKGVMHTFRTMSAAHAFQDLAHFTPSDRLISYLPLAHVAERAVLEMNTFKFGFQVFFAESLDTFIQDLQRAQPTVFGSVPRLWMKFQAGVHAKVPPQKLATLLSIPLISSLIRRKIVKGLGLSQVRVAVTGSAPTPPEVVAWYGRLGLQLQDVYGMSENFAVSHATRREEIRPGFVGSPMAGVTCKISDQQEILVKSTGCMVGYFKAEALTRELIDGEGFIHTGDRGELDEKGRLKITGRVKELFKTSKGKYVAPSPIENKLLANTTLEQACVCGANMSQPFALVVLAERLRKAADLGMQRESVTRQLEEHLAAVNAALDPHERLEKVIVMSDEWTVENGLLTPTLKLKRSAIESRYAPQVPGWHGASGGILWA